MDCLQIIPSYLAVLVSVLVAYIAYLQHKVARDRLKHDLYERRFAVYKAAQRLLTEVFQDADINYEKLIRYVADTQAAPFLFGEDIFEYLDKIRKKTIRLLEASSVLTGLPIGEERSEAAKSRMQIVKELTDEIPNLIPKFSPYLRFSADK